jgi:photosystem II stability/assembly factor-like uncharacterized protein
MFSSLMLTALVATAQPVAPAPKEKKEDKAPPFGAFKLRSIGPALTSGRVVGFAVDPSDRAKYFVAVACGGVWKTVNAGTTWTPVFDGESSYSIGCVVLDPKNSNTVWVGTGENNSQRSVAYGDGVYKSIDGGKSWTNMGLKTSEHIGKIIVDPRNSDVVYVAAQGPLWGPGGDRGLYKTTDGGKTWAKILSIDENTGVTDFLLDPRNPDIIHAASYQRRRHVWTLVNGGPGSGIHRSIDGGKTWKKLGGGLPGGELGRIGLAQAPTDPDTLYTIIEGSDKAGGIFRSIDNGITWEKRNPFDQQAQYYSHLTVDPTNKDRLYVMSVLIQVSDDGGKTLRNLGEASKHVDNHCIWVDPAHPNYYLVGCDGGIYESFDKAATWHFKSNLPVTQFYDIGVDQNPASGPFYHVYGGTQDNYTLGGPVRTRTSHGGTNGDWYVVQGGDGFHCKVDPTDPNTVYGEFQYGGLCRFDRKTGNRVDIQPQTAPGEPPLRWNWDSPLTISPHNPKRLYFAANKLFKSDDKGDSWKAVSPDLTRQLDRDKLPVMGKIQSPDAVSKHVSTSFYGNCVALAESPMKEGLIYVGTDDGLIQVTEDGGANWRKIETFPGVPEKTYVSKIVASQHNATTLFASFDNHKNADFKPYLLKSVDAGKTWTAISGDLPERGTVYCLAEDHLNPSLMFCGTEFGLFVTMDSGIKWHRLKNGLPTIQVKDLVIQKANDDLVVGTFGRGIYVIDDFSAMRSVSANPSKAAEIFPVKETIQYVRSAPYGFGTKGFMGESLYTAENPPHGATFTVQIKESPKTLKQLRKDKEKEAEKNKQPVPYPTKDELRAEIEEESATNLLVITDKEDSIITRLTCPTGEGVHRITWYLREAGTNPDADQGGFGPLAVPGTYKVQLVQKIQGETKPLTDARSFIVQPDPLSPLKADDYAEIATHNKSVKQLQRKLAAVTLNATELGTKIEAMKKAVKLTVKEQPEIDKKLFELSQKLKQLQRDLNGDSTLAARNENVPESIRSSVSGANAPNQSAIAKPTGTQKELLASSTKALESATGKLKEMIDKDAAEIEKAVEAAGVSIKLK